ncbi:hypothetical protein K439DRAFT_347317 [Ramaria rubella]|nr:hypothetical protein K439DRAFT_347317 [Ramaria rubella]
MLLCGKYAHPSTRRRFEVQEYSRVRGRPTGRTFHVRIPRTWDRRIGFCAAMTFIPLYRYFLSRAACMLSVRIVWFLRLITSDDCSVVVLTPPNIGYLQLKQIGIQRTRMFKVTIRRGVSSVYSSPLRPSSPPIYM